MESFLILETEPALRERLSHYFGAQGFSIDIAVDAASAFQRLEAHVFDVVILDVKAVDRPVEELVRAVKLNNGNAVIISMCEREKIDDAIRAIREGATDFIQKPINLAELEIKVDKGIELKRLNHEGQVLRGERNLIYRTKNFIGRSPAIRKVLALVDKVAQSSTSVVLMGETGTGKELIAGALHYNSQRAKGAFVRVNCATLPDALLESELFGHEKGAFTGADKLRIGRFEQANGGTVFLDEIADISLRVQTDLMRVLQEKEIVRVGGTQPVPVDFRCVAATNKRLEDLVKEGTFRPDLYYRLNVFAIDLPPLRERREDIPLLAAHFVQKCAGAMNRPAPHISAPALDLLLDYGWPGNVRELENAIERALLISREPELQPTDFPFQLHAAPAGVETGRTLEEVEKLHIRKVVEEMAWNLSRAARVLDIDRTTLYNKLKRYGLR